MALAAEKVGIDRSSAYQVRKRNAAFAASWERAQTTARARLAERGAPGERARLRADEVVRASKAGRPCIARAGPGRWSAKAERTFLAELAATANVRAAARAAGVSSQAAYNRRRLWPAFAEAWGQAKAEGYVRLEMLLIHAATATLDPAPEADAREAPAMTVEQAMKAVAAPLRRPARRQAAALRMAGAGAGHRGRAGGDFAQGGGDGAGQGSVGAARSY